MRPTIHWPDGKKICVMFSIAYEAFERAGKFKKNRQLDVNLTALSHSHYGGRVGIWRLMEIFNKNGVHASIAANGLAAKVWPESFRALHEGGHELFGHGYSNERNNNDLTAEQQRDDVRKTTQAIEEATGYRPVGWGSPGSVFTEFTLPILAEEGYMWCGDPIDDDNPYVVTVNGKRMAIVPKMNYANDFRAWGDGLMSGDDYFLGYKTAFDYIREDALRGKPGTIMAIMHAELSGRPHMAYAINKMIRYAKEHSDLVWFATRRECAEHCLATVNEAEEFNPWS